MGSDVNLAAEHKESELKRRVDGTAGRCKQGRRHKLNRVRAAVSRAFRQPSRGGGTGAACYVYQPDSI